jgi:hypothetical protein
MRITLFVLIVAASACGKAKKTEPATATGSSEPSGNAAVEPTPTPPPATPPPATPPAATPPTTPPAPPVSPALAQAISDATKIFSTVGPVLKDDADACDDSLKDLEKLLAGDLATEAKRFDAAMKDPAVAKEIQRMALDQNADETPLQGAWKDASVGAMHCGRSSDRLLQLLHVKLAK